jgi:hypothetical protein
MYLHGKRAKTAQEHVGSKPPPAGDRAASEAWMRVKQEKQRLTERQRYETMLANRRPSPPKLRPSQRKDDVNEAAHAKKEGAYEASLVAQAIRNASKGVK